MDSIVQPAATEQPSSSRNRLLLTVYTAAIFVSALLLFSVQPLFTKMVLPRLGGSPAVWSVAMVFFQSLLLAGYAYAHFLMQARSRVVPVAVHLALLIAAFVMLPLGIASGYGEPPASNYAFWLLGLFVVSIGLPFFSMVPRRWPGSGLRTVRLSPPTTAAKKPLRPSWSSRERLKCSYLLVQTASA